MRIPTVFFLWVWELKSNSHGSSGKHSLMIILLISLKSHSKRPLLMTQYCPGTVQQWRVQDQLSTDSDERERITGVRGGAVSSGTPKAESF